MNGGRREGITNPFFNKFKIECKRINTFIASLNPNYTKMFVKEKFLM